ncbi:hypothetical protein ARAM_001607 [Aspergillus rambellii]|uniref:Phytanoyl-CoA dioxygenase family protein n=1 Tax=Aspergillus rambellii TaxID=308745 RepID=A0A0F8U273_9EURO|nr:hypothetical protein ARAM_001607 [Aspergillus rambellii]
MAVDAVPAAPTPADQQRITALPELNAQLYENAEALAGDVIESLKQAGTCVVRQVFPREVVSNIEDELRPYFQEHGKIKTMAKETSITTGLASKSETFALRVLGNAMWHNVMEYFLISRTGPYWNGSTPFYCDSKPQLDSTLCFRVGPGAKVQGLHKDDMSHHNWQKQAQEYEQGRDASCVFFVALTKTTHANGATRVIPGSHLWDHSVPPPEESRVPPAPQLEPGDCLLTLGTTYHGAGGNTTADEYRLVACASATRSWLRQEENQYLSHDPKKIKNLPVWIQRFIGFTCGEPYMGWVDLADPLHAFNPEAEEFHDINR